MVLRPLVAPLLVAVALGVATYATSAATTRSGAGPAAVSGYQVADVDFQADESDPRRLAAVTFSLDPTPGPRAEAAVRLQPAGRWYACRLDGPRAVCATPGATLATADQLAVTVDG